MSKAALLVQKLCEEMRAKNRAQKAPVRKTRKEEKDDSYRSESAVIIDVRQQVFALDPRCICGSCVARETDEMHELRSRAQTRGQAAEIRFSTKNCVRLSRSCHRKVTGEVGHGKRLTIRVIEDDLGANGPLELVWKNGKRLTHQRAAPLPVPTAFRSANANGSDPEAESTSVASRQGFETDPLRRADVESLRALGRRKGRTGVARP